MTELLRNKTAVITGSSRGIGREIAKSLALEGVEIIGNYVDPKKEWRAIEIELIVESLGSKMKSVRADITEPGDRDSLLHKILADHPKGIDYLILNAAGGLEKDAPPDYARKINVESQLALVDTFLPHMIHGGNIIYLTSLWAHKYGEIKQPDFYKPIAETKHEAEMALRRKIPELSENGIKLGILCGPVIRGTATYLLLKRALRQGRTNPTEDAEIGETLQARDMGDAVKDMILSGFESGQTIYIGCGNTH